MNIQIDRSEFLKAWQMAEKTSSTKSTISAVSGILITAEEEKTTLEATDFKTSIRCSTNGVRLSSPGSAILPVKIISELLKKITSDVVTIEVKTEKGILTAGKSRTRFTTWPVGEFPSIPQSASAKKACKVMASDLIRTITEGSVASSNASDFPKYIGACLLQINKNELRVVSTDSRRLSLSKCSCESNENIELLLPTNALKELSRLISSIEPDKQIKILSDGSLAWFQFDDIEFSVRQVESSFPNYEKILVQNISTKLKISRNDFISALDRIDIIVRNSTRLVAMQLSPGGSMKLTGKAPQLGTGVEVLEAEIDGDPLKAGFNVGYLQDGLKAIVGDEVRLEFNGSEGQTRLFRAENDNFLYMLMPNRLSDQDFIDTDDEDEENGDNNYVEFSPSDEKSDEKEDAF